MASFCFKIEFMEDTEIPNSRARFLCDFIGVFKILNYSTIVSLLEVGESGEFLGLVIFNKII